MINLVKKKFVIKYHNKYVLSSKINTMYLLTLINSISLDILFINFEILKLSFGISIEN